VEGVKPGAAHKFLPNGFRPLPVQIDQTFLMARQRVFHCELLSLFQAGHFEPVQVNIKMQYHFPRMGAGCSGQSQGHEAFNGDGQFVGNAQNESQLLPAVESRYGDNDFTAAFLNALPDEAQVLVCDLGGTLGTLTSGLLQRIGVQMVPEMVYYLARKQMGLARSSLADLQAAFFRQRKARAFEGLSVHLEQLFGGAVGCHYAGIA